MYFDLRVRTEGFDLALLAASAEGEHAAVTGEPAAPAPLATPAAPPSESRQLVTLNEMGYFVAISIGAVALCAILYGILIAFFMLTLGASRGF